MITSPMEQFTIYKIMGLPNVVVYLMISAMIPITIFYITTAGSIVTEKTRDNKTTQQTNNYGILQESQIASISRQIISYLGKTNIYLLPMFYSIFYIIQFANLQGQVPYNNTATVEQVITQTLAGTLLQGVLIQGMIIHKQYQIAAYIPSGTPIFLLPQMFLQEIQAFITRTQSLGLRLAVNMITGHIQAKVIIGFVYTAYQNNVTVAIYMFGLIFLSLFFAQELLIAYLQAYIFMFITCLTLHDYL